MDYHYDCENIGNLGVDLKVCIESIGASRGKGFQNPAPQIGLVSKKYVILRPADKLCPTLRGCDAGQSDGVGNHKILIFVAFKVHGLECGRYCAETRIGGFIPDKYLPAVRCAVANFLPVVVKGSLRVLGVDNGERHVIGDIAKSMAAILTNRERDINTIDYRVVQNMVGSCIKGDCSTFVVFNLE